MNSHSGRTMQRTGLSNKDYTKLGISTWNVRGTKSAGKFKNLSQVCDEYKIDIMALQETKQSGNAITESDGYIVFNSGYETKYMGTGFMVRKRIKHTVVDFEPVSERICKLRIRGKYRKITIVNVHAPTEIKEEEEKDSFYEELAKVIGKIPRYDVKIVLGDLNAKIGKEAMYNDITGGHSKHELTNENGKKLIEFATEMRMKIMSTSFQRKEIYKGTWVSPDGNTCNQIDHVLIERKHANCIKNVRSQRGAECESDHFMVKIALRQEVPRAKKDTSGRMQRFEVSGLQNENIRQQFGELTSNSRVTPINTETVEEKWKRLENIIEESSKLVLKKDKKAKCKDWFDEDCKRAMIAKNKANIQLIHKNDEESRNAYVIKKKAFKKLCRNKKRERTEEMLNRAEENYKSKAIRNFYQDVKKHKEGYQTKTIYCKDKNGLLLTGEGKRNRWKEYFENLLNCIVNEDGRENAIEVDHETNVKYEELIKKPTVDQITKIINEQKNNKSPGENGIAAEIYKYGGDEIQRQIAEIVMEVWEQEQMPRRWKESVIYPVFKKGDKTICSNYRGIALLDAAYKIFATCLRNKIGKLTEELLGEYQAGFRGNKSTTDQVYVLKHLIANSYEHNLDLHMLFIDFKQAYDTISKRDMLKILRELGIPDKLIRLINMTHEDTSCKVLVDGRISENFKVVRGLRQGDPISPLLFNLVLEGIIRRSGLSRTGTIYRQRHQILAYADDIVLVTRSKTEMQRIFERLEQEARAIGLMINKEKTKFMKIKKGEEEQKRDWKIQVENNVYSFEEVTNFTYLGVTLTNDNEEDTEIKTRIMKGSKCVGSLYKFLKSKSISRAAKLRTYKTIIRPTVLFGCELWVLSKRNQQILEVWERKILRTIFGGKKSGDLVLRRTNIEVTELYNDTNITGVIKGQRLRWLGHIVRMTEDKVVKKVFKGGVVTKKRRGRPKETWFSAVKKDIELMGIRRWKELAADRAKWRRVIQKAMSL